MTKIADKALLPRTERRYVCQDIRIEKRDDSGTAEGDQVDESKIRTIKGHAAVFNTRSKPVWGWFYEIIMPGAFTEVLATSPDVRALFNHDDNMIMARTKAGTLELREDEKGLAFVFDVPNTNAGNDLLENVRLGNISECSFQFRCEPDDQEWEPIVGALQGEPGETRTINKVCELLDISLVTFPQYGEAEADICKRSKTEWEAFKNPKPEVDLAGQCQRDAMLRLAGV